MLRNAPGPNTVPFMTQTPGPVSAQPASPVFAPAPGSAVVQVSGHLVSHDAQSRPIGKVRSTGMCFVLMVITLGFYSLFMSECVP